MPNDSIAFAPELPSLQLTCRAVRIKPRGRVALTWERLSLVIFDQVLRLGVCERSLIQEACRFLGEDSPHSAMNCADLSQLLGVPQITLTHGLKCGKECPPTSLGSDAALWLMSLQSAYALTEGRQRDAGAAICRRVTHVTGVRPEDLATVLGSWREQYCAGGGEELCPGPEAVWALAALLRHAQLRQVFREALNNQYTLEERLAVHAGVLACQVKITTARTAPRFARRIPVDHVRAVRACLGLTPGAFAQALGLPAHALTKGQALRFPQDPTEFEQVAERWVRLAERARIAPIEDLPPVAAARAKVSAARAALTFPGGASSAVAVEVELRVLNARRKLLAPNPETAPQEGGSPVQGPRAAVLAYLDQRIAELRQRVCPSDTASGGAGF